MTKGTVVQQRKQSQSVRGRGGGCGRRPKSEYGLLIVQWAMRYHPGSVSFFKERNGERVHPVIQEGLQKTHTDIYNIPTYT